MASGRLLRPWEGGMCRRPCGLEPPTVIPPQHAGTRGEAPTTTMTSWPWSSPGSWPSWQASQPHGLIRPQQKGGRQGGIKRPTARAWKLGVRQRVAMAVAFAAKGGHMGMGMGMDMGMPHPRCLC